MTKQEDLKVGQEWECEDEDITTEVKTDSSWELTDVESEYPTLKPVPPARYKCKTCGEKYTIYPQVFTYSIEEQLVREHKRCIRCAANMIARMMGLRGCLEEVTTE